MDLFQYHYKYDAFDAIQHKLLVRDTMNPGQTRLKDKMFFPILYWWYTFGEKQICVKKMSEKIMIKTSGPQKIIGYKTSCKFDYSLSRKLHLYTHNGSNTRSLTY